METPLPRTGPQQLKLAALGPACHQPHAHVYTHVYTRTHVRTRPPTALLSPVWFQRPGTARAKGLGVMACPSEGDACLGPWTNPQDLPSLPGSLRLLCAVEANEGGGRSGSERGPQQASSGCLVLPRWRASQPHQPKHGPPALTAVYFSFLAPRAGSTTAKSFLGWGRGGEVGGNGSRQETLAPGQGGAFARIREQVPP